MPDRLIPPAPVLLHLLPHYLQVSLHLLFATRVPHPLPHGVGSVGPKIFGVGVAHARALRPGLIGSIEGHDHLLGLQKLFFIVTLGYFLADLRFLVGVEAQNLLVVFKLKFEAEVGTDIGPAGADMFDGRCEGLLIFFHVVGNNECG